MQIRLIITLLFFAIFPHIGQAQQDQSANLVLPAAYGDFYLESYPSKNGKYTLLVGPTSRDYGTTYYSVLLNLEQKKFVKIIPSSELIMDGNEDTSLKDVFGSFEISNNGKWLACQSINQNEIHIISLVDFSFHKTYSLAEADSGRSVSGNVLFRFSNDFEKLFVRGQQNFTYVFDLPTLELVNKIENENQVLQFHIYQNHLYQQEIESETNFIRQYNLKDLSLNRETELEFQSSSWFCKTIFSKAIYAQQNVITEKELFSCSILNLSADKIFDLKIPFKKIGENIVQLDLIDIEYDVIPQTLYLTIHVGFTEFSGENIVLLKYDLVTGDYKIIEDVIISNFIENCDGNSTALTAQNELFYLNRDGIELEEYQPSWYNLKNQKFSSISDNAASQRIHSVSQKDSKTIFTSNIYGIDGISGKTTEIDLSTGELVNVFNLKESNLEIGGFPENQIDFDNLYKDYSSYVSDYSIKSDSISNFYYPKDSAIFDVEIQCKNYKRHIISNNSKGSIDLFNFKKPPLENLLSISISMNDQYTIYAPDRYYMLSSGASNFLYFEKNINLYPFEQFDLKYNRPDIILDRLGYADSSLVDAYHSAYQKRLKKMGFTQDMLQDDFHLPEIKIENFEEMPTLHDQGSIDLNLKLEDTKYKLDRINVWVNDVAIYGTDGISLRDKNIQEYTTTISVDLAKGKNKVQVSALNQAGAESYKETFNIECTAGKVKPNLYLITIGESEFKQSNYNLTYAAKDASDIADLFSKSKAYDTVYNKILVNEQVTKANVLALKSFFEKADINDQVMIFIAGHGVLDVNYDYYFATYNMDFANPKEKGLAYEDLESLLDGINPIKKTLLIDACHSGEVDKDEIELASTEVYEQGEIRFRSVGNSIQQKLGMQNTSELTRALFTDLRKGTGATVISSAGGMEFAMEGAEWKNGLYTFCLLNGIESNKADLDKDGEIWLSELQKYVSEQVTELSGGKQQPTSRIENQTVDFRVW